MNRNTEQILRKIYQDNSERDIEEIVPKEVIGAIEDINTLIGRANGTLQSRQIIANIVYMYDKDRIYIM